MADADGTAIAWSSSPMGKLHTWMMRAAGLGIGLFATSLSYGQSPSVSNLRLVDDDRILTESDRDLYFNAARCACDSSLVVAAAITVASDVEGTFALVSGQSCVSSDGELDDDCETLYAEDVSDVPTQLESATSVAELSGGCGEKEQNRNVYAIHSPQDDETWSVLSSLPYSVDTERPPAPSPNRVIPGEGIAEVAFSAPDATADVAAYQVLCRTATSGANLPSGIDAEFDTTIDLCGEGERLLDRPCASATDGPSSTTVTGLDNGVPYVFEVVSIDEARNASSPVEVGTATPAPEEDFWERYVEAGGQANGEHCFIATAAYGDYDDHRVRVLRRFRDNILRTTSVGRLLIRAYYTLSPAWAAWIARSDSRRTAARWLLTPFVAYAELATTGWTAVLLPGLLLPVLVLRRRRATMGYPA